MNTPSIQQLLAALQNSWSEETSFTPDEWSPQNPARGQCLVSTLVLQDYLGGGLQRYDIKADNFEETHYCNVLPGGAILDATAAQYTQPVQLTVTPINLKGYATARERYLAHPDTQTKYELLKGRIIRALSQ
jgi:hypothetical protein